MPVFVKIDDAVNPDPSLLNRIVKAIRAKRQVGFQYSGKKGSNAIELEPYRVVYFDGFWYLIGREPATDRIKSYALDKIKDLRLLKSAFRSIPATLIVAVGPDTELLCQFHRDPAQHPLALYDDHFRHQGSTEGLFKHTGKGIDNVFHPITGVHAKWHGSVPFPILFYYAITCTLSRT